MWNYKIDIHLQGMDLASIKEQFYQLGLELQEAGTKYVDMEEHIEFTTVHRVCV